MTKRKVRRGFQDLLRGSCAGGRNPKISVCGGRQSTYDDFTNGCRSDAEAFAILLVDAEGPVTAPSPKLHLAQRDGWGLAGVGEDQVHLMVQTFEAWVVADQDAIEKFYGPGFSRGALPQRANLEEVPKDDLKRALASATRNTNKRTYHKINHGPSILAKANRDVVKEKCRHCKRLLGVLAQL